MGFYTRAITLAAAAILFTTTIASAQSADGTTLAGGNKGKVAKMSESKKSGSRMKADGMKSVGMEKSSTPTTRWAA